MARLSTVVAVGLASLTAVQSDMTDLSTSVTFHLLAQLLDVTKPAAGVALLLVGVRTVTSDVTRFAAGEAQRLPLLLRLLAIAGNVATPPAVVA